MAKKGKRPTKAAAAKRTAHKKQAKAKPRKMAPPPKKSQRKTTGDSKSGENALTRSRKNILADARSVAARVPAGLSDLAPLQEAAVPPVRAMKVKAELKGGATNLRIAAYRLDTVAVRPQGDPVPVDLISGNGVVPAVSGLTYVLDWRFDGLLGASVQITVNYPPPENAAPGVSGPQASQVKHEDTTIITGSLGFNEGFLRVPGQGAVT
jgi:hypothetical protein